MHKVFKRNLLKHPPQGQFSFRFHRLFSYRYMYVVTISAQCSPHSFHTSKLNNIPEIPTCGSQHIRSITGTPEKFLSWLRIAYIHCYDTNIWSIYVGDYTCRRWNLHPVHQLYNWTWHVQVYCNSLTTANVCSLPSQRCIFKGILGVH